MPRLQAIVFDVGEVLVDEERLWGRWADRIGVSRFVFFATLGAIIERGEHHRRVFEELAPGFDVDAAIAADPVFGAFDGDDLYPDVRPCLETLRSRGYRLGVAGNQPPRAEAALEAMNLPVDFIVASERWGVEKPSPDFFARVAEACRARPDAVAYVGDRIDNDVVPAKQAGMVSVHIRRGPWGQIQSRRAGAPKADLSIDSLADLADGLERLA